MRRYGIALHWKSFATLLALLFASLSTGRVRAQIMPLPDSPPASPPTTSPAPKPRPQPIELRDVIWAGRYGGFHQTQVPLQGGKLIEGADFYRAIEREDLARSYEARAAGRVALVAGGFLAMIAGSVVLASTTEQAQAPCQFVSMPYPYSPPQLVCPPDSSGNARAIGIGLLAVGPLLAVGSLALNPEPVSPAERRRLVDAYNASLGAPAAEAAPARARGAGFSIAFNPIVSPSGAGLTLGGRF
jgi:hypothetical protein